MCAANDDDDDRLTARIWATTINVALGHCIRTNYRGFDLDLAFVINEANALHLAAKIACQEAEIDFDELLDCMRDLLDKQSTKLARVFFERERRRLVDICKGIHNNKAQSC
jgi:hypothetical protein